MGLAGGGLLLGAGGSAWLLRGRAPTVEGLSVLSPHRFRTLSALARTHLPVGGAFEQGGEQYELARAFDAFLTAEPPENVRDLETALTLVEFGPLIFDRRLATFSNLSPTDQLEHWRTWIVSDSLLRRKVALAFRKFLSLVFYDHPDIWPALGYPGPRSFRSE